MSAQDHPIAGTVFLVVAASTIGLLAHAGMRHSADLELAQEIDRAEKEARSGNTAKAEQLLREVVRRSPDKAVAEFDLGLAQLELHEDDEADKSFARVLELDPNDYEAMACRALIFKHKGKVDEALTTLEKIPVGKGRVVDLLENDLSWEDLDGNARMNALRKKHNLPPRQSHENDTSLLKNEQQIGYGGSPVAPPRPPPGEPVNQQPKIEKKK
jgi:tetratricopeptide (TPR) repeat protein